MCRLKVKNYGDLNARLRRVHERITSNNPRMVQVLESIRQEPVLQNDFVEALAEQEGFDPLWMTQDAPDAKVKAAAKAKTGQQSLPKMMAAAAASNQAAVPPNQPAVPVPVPAQTVASAVNAMGPPLVPKAKATAVALQPAVKAGGPVHVPTDPTMARPVIVVAPSLPRRMTHCCFMFPNIWKPQIQTRYKLKQTSFDLCFIATVFVLGNCCEPGAVFSSHACTMIPLAISSTEWVGLRSP